MRQVAIDPKTAYVFKEVRTPFNETLEVTVGPETYQIIDQRLGIAINVKTGEYVTLEMEETPAPSTGFRNRMLSLVS